MSDLTLYTPAGLAARQRAAEYAESSMASATVRAYRADWRDYEAWAGAAGCPALPALPGDVAAYLASLAATHAPSTIKRRLAAIGQMHRLHGHSWAPDDPAIRHTLRGILREHGRPTVKADALMSDTVRRLVATCADDARGRRDRALLLIGFAGALRRSELVALRIENVRRSANGLRVRLVGTKTDQENRGQEIGIPPGADPETCPVRAFEAWRALLPHKTGPLFPKISKGGTPLARALWPDAVRYILLARAAAAELDLAVFERFSPHGLRAGMITEAFQKGAREADLAKHSRHRDLKTLHGYYRPARMLDDTPAKLLDL
jgi:integrase